MKKLPRLETNYLSYETKTTIILDQDRDRLKRIENNAVMKRRLRLRYDIPDNRESERNFKQV